MRTLLLILLLLLFILITGAEVQKNFVEIKKENNSWSLTVNGHPFYIKGVVGNSFLEKVKEYGGNSVRIGPEKDKLDRVYQLGLSALVNLPARAERDGMNYNDTSEIRKQTERIISIVKKTKDHPAVMMWAIGNELDYIPPLEPFNPKVWDAVNETAKAIKAIDPAHPVMTVIGDSKMEKVADIVKRCPDIDLLGTNCYGSIESIPATLKKYGWIKPYVITEWGPDGYWEVRKTSWGAAYEQTGLEKYLCYEKRYKNTMDPKNNQCLGSYVFYWSGFKQEHTHTWFCMLDSTGLESPLVGLMHYLWTGERTRNSPPIVDSINIEDFVRYQDIALEKDVIQKAKVTVCNPDKYPLMYRWEIRPEAKYAAYAGQGEKVPSPVQGLISDKTEEISFKTPSSSGAYRLFVYIYDQNGHFSTSNLPFYIR
jgi:Glycosyl hydrolases family 2, TIM barrel domain